MEKFTYQIEGPLREGVTHPQVAVYQMYDIRIAKEAAPAFMAQFNIQDPAPSFSKKGNARFHGIGIFAFFLRIFRKLLRMKTIKPNAEDPKNINEKNITGWHYAVLIGCADDPSQISPVTGIKKEEVL